MKSLTRLGGLLLLLPLLIVRTEPARAQTPPGFASGTCPLYAKHFAQATWATSCYYVTATIDHDTGPVVFTIFDAQGNVLGGGAPWPGGVFNLGQVAGPESTHQLGFFVWTADGKLPAGVYVQAEFGPYGAASNPKVTCPVYE